jgi:hypothetical protein
MSDPTSWKGFKPTPDPVTLKESPQEQLDKLDRQLQVLEDKRKELLFEVAKEEAKEDDSLHGSCTSEEDLEEYREDMEAELREEIRHVLGQFGGHRPSCCEGALAGTQKLHRLCTCGWNEVATQLERA